ncbi:MAG TPA: hypothetical protein VKF36_02185 [Syntrophorhabdales bacterium]|nr:hypothetical protein [Syntrophorhabdales bacterium]
MSDEQQAVHHPPRVRRVRRRRKRSLKSRIKRALKGSGTDKRLYIVAAGVLALVAAVYLFDLLFAVFPIKK